MESRLFTEPEIKKRYKVRAKEVHPDRTGGSAAEFIRLTKYYSILLGIHARKQTKTQKEVKRFIKALK